MSVCYAIPDGDEIENVIVDKSAYKNIIMLNQVVCIQKIDGRSINELLLDTALGVEANNSECYRIRIEFTNNNHHTFTYTNRTVRDKVLAELIDALNKYHSR